MKYILIDVGCIECGEQTEVLGIFDTREHAEKAYNKFCKINNLEAESRGGILEFIGLHNKRKTTYLYGNGYFNGGQHALEIHQFPARKLK